MADQPHVMIAVARFYEDIADELVRGATLALQNGGATFEIVEVPGAFELPAAVSTALRALEFVGGRRRFDGYVTLGCVIRGETSHYDYVCGETARGLQDLAVKYCLALGFGLLTVETREQAEERAGVDRRDKGGEAARVCLSMIELKRAFGLFPR
ncbi:MAG: 6,7-dimethyl-8-ribityllumazine synthase [Alphaproteobacteria bacterium]|nr:6,7-dimethyl-8-ribityllumazine synthase [Alphaproteobacteria bacterium]